MMFLDCFAEYPLRRLLEMGIDSIEDGAFQGFGTVITYLKKIQIVCK